ncbi:uncharacterized protein [Ptychodera flava]|uniref:uncharacterized protein n=1 Tax=Ptychodera flava TaxID=63121 RepID=UPI003969F402
MDVRPTFRTTTRVFSKTRGPSTSDSNDNGRSNVDTIVVVLFVTFILLIVFVLMAALIVINFKKKRKRSKTRRRGQREHSMTQVEEIPMTTTQTNEHRAISLQRETRLYAIPDKTRKKDNGKGKYAFRLYENVPLSCDSRATKAYAGGPPPDRRKTCFDGDKKSFGSSDVHHAQTFTTAFVESITEGTRNNRLNVKPTTAHESVCLSSSRLENGENPYELLQERRLSLRSETDVEER